ncbi:MAG TPA: phosphatase PAP2 family protein [Verrucomicrobiae bacterium]|nr:phosphatase PAP2 family protein [Verrucomicrobiae bacterium]
MKGPDTGLLESQARPAPAPVASAKAGMKVLPHEVVFTAFLLITWFRLVAKGHLLSIPAMAFLAFILLSAGMIRWSAANPTPTRWRLRLLFYPALMGASFYSLTPAMALMNVPNADALLNSWDVALLGRNLSVVCQRFVSPWLTDLMMAGYLFYFIYLIGGPATYCIKDLPRFKLCIVGMFTVMGLGYLGYTLWPAGGPHLHHSFERPLEGSWFTALAAPLILRGSNGVDVFPSIHLAVSLYLLGFDWCFNRRRFRWVLGPCVVLWVSTIYLRYHYFVDLLAGTVVAAAGWVVTAWSSRKT